MIITIINNQPIRFQNIDSIDESCNCLGQGFCQLVNKNDVTKFQIESGTNLITNGTFDENLDGWITNGSWIWDDDGWAECINESGLNPLQQENVFTTGKFYAMTFTIGVDEEEDGGGFTIDSFGETEYETYGTFTVIGQALFEDLIITPFNGNGGECSVTIDSIEIYELPVYSIKDVDGNEVFTLDDVTGITASGGIIQYEIDWTEIDEGCYQIYISDESIDYVSDCLTLALAHDCTLLLSWTNDEDAYGFNYSDLSFTQLLRVKAKLWQPNYPKEKNVFKDNAGNRRILKSETSKEELLTIGEMPEYLHDSLAIGLEHDDFYIDGVKYTNEETEYTPKWRKSSQLAPSEVAVIKDQLLKNNNC
jgi:hypothetical protein